MDFTTTSILAGCLMPWYNSERRRICKAQKKNHVLLRIFLPIFYPKKISTIVNPNPKATTFPTLSITYTYVLKLEGIYSTNNFFNSKSACMILPLDAKKKSVSIKLNSTVSMF